MKLTVLGCGTLLPDPRRGAPGFLLRSGTSAVLIDSGSGTLQRLARAGADPVGLDAAVYTHRHLDHCADLPAILFAMKNQAAPARLRDFPIYAGQGFGEHLERLVQVYGSALEPQHFDVNVFELPLDGPGSAELPGGLRLDTLPARHGKGALHLRFTDSDGRTVAFSGDTGPSEGLERLAAGADLLVSECALAPDERMETHMGAEDVRQLVAASRPRRVVLTHLYPRHDFEADVGVVASTGVSTLLAHDGLELEIA